MGRIITSVLALVFGGWTHGVSFTTWNPADVSINLTLSPGNLIATNNHDQFTGTVRSKASTTSKKIYFEFVFAGPTTGAGDGVIGIAPSTLGLTVFVGNSSDSIGVNDSGSIFGGNGAIGINIGAAFVSGVTVGRVAFDPNAGLFWGARAGGNWNGDPTAHPETGTGGISLTYASTNFAAASLADVNNSVTANFGATTFTFTPPTGFSAL